jgi:hypothetical protein
VPTAELEPILESYVQSDKADMGMTYDELTIFGRLRKVQKLGPYGMFQRLVHEWSIDRTSAHNRPYKKPGLGWPGTRPRGTLRPGRPGGLVTGHALWLNVV